LGTSTVAQEFIYGRWSNTEAAGAEMDRSQFAFKDVPLDGSDADIQPAGSIPFSKQIFSHAIGFGKQARSAKKGPIALKMDGIPWPSVAAFGAIKCGHKWPFATRPVEQASY
jgi:hypothetical protein